MKKILFTLSAMTLCVGMYAQQTLYWGDVPIIPESVAHAISRDGKLTAGETMNGGFFSRNNETGKIYYYPDCSGGMGNYISSNGWIVGANKTSMKAAVLSDNNIKPVASLSGYMESYLYGITWDGSRICGLVSNPDLSSDDDILDPSFHKQMYLPFYCDVTADGEIGEPVFLPHPDKDFLNAVPQYSSALCISDDGHIIAGQVVDNSGRYMYPIVYKEDEDGNWTYSLPSEPLFNTKGLDVPQYPLPEMDAPQAWDYIKDEAARKRFEEAVENWDGEEDSDPYLHLNFYMTDSEMKEYNEALADYLEYYNYYTTVVLEEYYNELAQVILNSTFFLQGNIAMDPSGKLLSQTRLTTYVNSQLQPIKYNTPVIFNLEEDTWKILGDDFTEMEVNQILSDGTLIATTPAVSSSSPDITPQHSYVMTPDGEEFIPIEDYLSNVNPEYAEWMHEYLFHKVPVASGDNGIVYKEMTVTGLVSVSDDFSSLCAGVDGWAWNLEDGMYFSYVLDIYKAGIEDVISENFNNGNKGVFNLQGIKVLDSYENALNKLPKGIYIINGKKVAINGNK